MQHPPGLLDALRHGLGLIDAVGHGLLHVDILAGVERVDRHAVMPVVGRDDEDGIDVRTREQLLVIVVNIVLRQAQKFAGALLALGIDIADRRDLDAIFGLQHPDVGETHSTDADDADVNAVVGAEHAGRRQRGGAEEFAARGHCILPAKPSRSLASSTSLALTPPASCVVRSTITLFQTLNHSG